MIAFSVQERRAECRKVGLQVFKSPFVAMSFSDFTSDSPKLATVNSVLDDLWVKMQFSWEDEKPFFNLDLHSLPNIFIGIIQF